MLIPAFLSFSIFFSACQAVSPIVQLSYGSYQGTPLSNGLTQWLGMRYAAAPVGNLRFAAPQNPPGHEGIEPANSLTPGCMGTGPGVSGSEDCLFADVYAPSSAKGSSKLPVYVFIQGGGFNGDGSHMNASSLIPASGMNMVVVSFTYRGGPLGFLASTQVQKSGSLNNGLKDQRRLLQWVQLHIASFGGDPGHVTLGGQSAGAGSVTQHLVAYGGRNDNLFHAAAAQSQSFPAVRTIAQSQYQYDGLVSRAGCASASDTLACLRGLSIEAFQAADTNSQPFPGATGDPIFPYNPVLDNDFVTDYPLKSFAAGNFVKVPTIFGDDTNEGTIFTDQTISNQAQAEAFLVNQFPELTPADLAQYTTMYALNSPNPPPFWHHPSLAYGETRYICPGIALSTAFAAHGVSNTWNYRYDVLDPVSVAGGFNVAHGAEMPAIWGPQFAGGPASYYGANKGIVPIMQGYWTSFIRSFDPNTFRAQGTPEWGTWDGLKMDRLRLVGAGTVMETVDEAQAGRCKYISGIAVSIGQ